MNAAVTTPGPGVTELPRPWTILEERIPATAREAAHVHVDLCYLLEADDGTLLRAHDAEVSAARWWDRASIADEPDVADTVRSFAATYLT